MSFLAFIFQILAENIKFAHYQRFKMTTPYGNTDKYYGYKFYILKNLKKL